MRAGELLSGASGQRPAPAAIASGLLALTKLDQAGLAVTLLVDLWNDENNQVSTEAAILVIDAALDSEKAVGAAGRCGVVVPQCNTSDAVSVAGPV